MAEQKHTPGPWTVPHFAEPDTDCECGYVLCDRLMGAIATVHCSGEGTDWKKSGDNPKFAEACANARLIAASPDLLACLKQLLASNADNESDEATHRAEHRAATNAALAAIAKAEGR